MDTSVPPSVIEFLSTRSSTPISAIGLPAPSDDEIETMVSIASRVPDHGRLTPWRFILYRGEAREQVGQYLVDLAEEREGPLTDQRREQELKRFARAPLVIGVIFSPVEHHIPEWEQFLSSGAAAIESRSGGQCAWLCHELDQQLVFVRREGPRTARIGAA